jgi:hypothetical protein
MSSRKFPHLSKSDFEQMSILELAESMRDLSREIKNAYGLEHLQMECVCELCGGLVPDDDAMWCTKCQEYSGEWKPVNSKLGEFR